MAYLAVSRASGNRNRSAKNALATSPKREEPQINALIAKP
jgi:hypothetical protein